MLAQVRIERRFSEIAAAATAIGAKLASWPWSTVIVGKIDAAIVPGVAVGIEAATAFDGDKRRFRNVARAELEERIGRGLRTVLASIEER